jgi:lysophospholipase L1-like esterase
VRAKKKILIFSVLAVVLFFAAAEIVVRLVFTPYRAVEINVEKPGQLVGRDVSIFRSDPVLFWKNRPNIKDEIWDFTPVSTNSKGLRYREIGAKAARTIRILCLGDSITFGYRVIARNCYPLILERTLSMCFPTRHFEVIPFAVSGYSSFQSYLFLKNEGLALKPDLAIVNSGWNDVYRENCPDAVAFERSAPVSAVQRIARKSQLYLRLRSVIVLARDKLRGKDGEKPRRVSKEEYVRNFCRIRSLARAHGCEAIWLAPFMQNLTRHPDEAKALQEYREALVAYAARHHVPCVNIALLTEAGWTRNLRLFDEAIHPNDRGHHLVARELTKYLLDNNPLHFKKDEVAHARRMLARYYDAQASLPANPDPASLVPGLLRSLYDGTAWSGELLGLAVDAPIDFVWKEETAKPIVALFSTVWEGYVRIPEHGTYVFATMSDDTSRLYIDDELVVDNTGREPSNYKRGEKELDVGIHRIKLYYNEMGWGGFVHLYWKPPSSVLEEIIPAEYLLHPAD